MKRIDRLLLRSFIGPLVLTFTISVFVLLMQFVWKYIDDMVGKGLDFSVIMELLMYASATFVPMALPIAVLFASIMTMGNFGERYELVAMKAGGISIRRAMTPLALVALLLTGMAFYFANNVMPSAMLHYRMTLYDITRKKPAVNIRPGEYYKEIEGYVIRVGSKSQDGRTLQDVIIYDHTRGITETNVIVAREGEMYTTPDDRFLLFTLRNGYTYTEPTTGENFEKRPLTAIGFDQQTISFDISSFAYNKSGEDIFKGSYQMMNVAQLDTAINALEAKVQRRYSDCRQDIDGNMHFWHLFAKEAAVKGHAVSTLEGRLDSLSAQQVNRVRNHLNNRLNSAVSDAEIYSDLIKSDREYINRHYIEKNRKFTLSIACLLLFLIGAPFGSIVRKGGMGLPLVASVGFFVLYYVVGMIAEKAIRESAIGPWGMWISSLVMLPIGIILTYSATTDSALFDLASWRKTFGRIFSRKKKPTTIE